MFFAFAIGDSCPEIAIWALVALFFYSYDDCRLARLIQHPRTQK